MKQTITKLASMNSPPLTSSTTSTTTHNMHRLSNSYSASTTSIPSSLIGTPRQQQPTSSSAGGLSQSLRNPGLTINTNSPSVPTSGNNYRTIKARYFSSLNLSSPLKNRLMEEQQYEQQQQQLDGSNSGIINGEEQRYTSPKRKISAPAVPIPIPMNRSNSNSGINSSNDNSNNKILNYRRGVVVEDDQGFVSSSSTSPISADTTTTTTSPVQNIINRRAKRPLFNEQQNNTYSDAFLFGEMEQTYRNTPHLASGKFNFAMDDDDEYTDDDSPTQFLPPHLLNKRSDFSLYQHEKKIQMQKRFKQLNI